jgi:glycosyltransferase involved in cell wall biosynthesis
MEPALERHTIIVPTYNERDNIQQLVAGILELGLDSRIIIVDDNSPDGTGRLADGLAEMHSVVRAIHRPGKLGLGTAHVAGMKAALANGASYVLTMDADFSHHPRYIPSLLGLLTTVDVAIGSRYVAGGGTIHCTPPRRALSRGANLFARTMLGLHASDATAGFRAYRREVLESISLDGIMSDGYSFLVEVLYRCERRGWTTGEIPILFENRQRGSSKISQAEILKAMQLVLRLGGERLVSKPESAK